MKHAVVARRVAGVGVATVGMARVCGWSWSGRMRHRRWPVRCVSGKSLEWIPGRACRLAGVRPWAAGAGGGRTAVFGSSPCQSGRRDAQGFHHGMKRIGARRQFSDTLFHKLRNKNGGNAFVFQCWINVTDCAGPGPFASSKISSAASSNSMGGSKPMRRMVLKLRAILAGSRQSWLMWRAIRRAGCGDDGGVEPAHRGIVRAPCSGAGRFALPPRPAWRNWECASSSSAARRRVMSAVSPELTVTYMASTVAARRL